MTTGMMVNLQADPAASSTVTLGDLSAHINEFLTAATTQINGDDRKAAQQQHSPDRKGCSPLNGSPTILRPPPFGLPGALVSDDDGGGGDACSPVTAVAPALLNAAGAVSAVRFAEEDAKFSHLSLDHDVKVSGR